MRNFVKQLITIDILCLRFEGCALKTHSEIWKFENSFCMQANGDETSRS